MRRAFGQYRVIAAAGLPIAILCLGGCDSKKQGPKREDHKAAHAAHYHPDVDRSQPATAAASATSQPFDLTFPAEIPEGDTGTPVMFVIGKPLTVQEVLEPLMPELQEMARSASSEREYYRSIAKTIAEEIRHQASMIVIYDQAKKKLTESAEEYLAKEADKAIQRVINAHFGGARTRYEAHLAALNLTMKDIQERTKQQLLVSNYLHERFEPLVSDPPRRDLLNYYQAHLKEFTTPAKAELQMIEVPLHEELGKPVSQATEEEISAARQRARDHLRRAREEIDSGVDFASVARTYSKGPQRANSGSWGEISPGTLTGSYAIAGEILFALDEGQISEIIETEDSSFIIRCTRKKPETRLTFEEAQARIIQKVREQEYGRLTSRYIGELLSKASIDERQRQAFFIAAVLAAPRPNAGQSMRDTGGSPGN